jgi:hypothetical protein
MSATVQSTTAPSLEDQLLALIEAGLNFGRAVPVFAEHQRQTEPHLSAYADGAGNTGFLSEGEVEVDGDAIVSEGSDGGYVMAWVFVSHEDAGIEQPEGDDETTAQEEHEED